MSKPLQAIGTDIIRRLEGILVDGPITEAKAKEIEAVLDTDSDGKLTIADMNPLGFSQFQDIKQMLAKHGFDINVRLNVEIKRVPFKEYNPVPAQNKFEYKDPVMSAYFAEGKGSGTIRSEAEFMWMDDKEEIKGIKDRNKFKALIIGTAQKIGHSEDDIKKMSIHEAVMLAGRLVAERLDYEKGMIGKEETEFFDPRNGNLGERLYGAAMVAYVGEKIDMRTDVAKAIDGMAPDEIFESGRGICRNYAFVNAAVFSILKDINPDLKNTYMTAYSAEDLAHSIRLPHAWNMVTTLTSENSQLTTFVDPTWLDTRNKTAMNDPSASRVAESSGQLYNALDEDHFGEKLFRIYQYDAQFFEVAGTNGRTFKKTAYAAGEAVTTIYQGMAFERRLLQIDVMLGMKNVPLFASAEAVQFAVEDLIGSPLAMPMKYDIENFQLSDPDGIEKLQALFEKISKMAPKILDEELPYNAIDSSIQKTTPRQIFARLGIK